MVKENQIWKVVLGKDEFIVCVLKILPGLHLAEPKLLKFCEYIKVYLDDLFEMSSWRNIP